MALISLTFRAVPPQDVDLTILETGHCTRNVPRSRIHVPTFGPLTKLGDVSMTEHDLFNSVPHRAPRELGHLSSYSGVQLVIAYLTTRISGKDHPKITWNEVSVDPHGQRMPEKSLWSRR